MGGILHAARLRTERERPAALESYRGEQRMDGVIRPFRQGVKMKSGLCGLGGAGDRWARLSESSREDASSV